MSLTAHISYFGLLAERRGLAQETLLHECLTAGSLYDLLAGQYPLRVPAGSVVMAVNDMIVPYSQPLAEGDRVAFMPPMSGG